MKKSQIGLFLMVLLGLSILGCQQEENSVSNQGSGIELQDENHLKGKTIINGHSIYYEAKGGNALFFQIEIIIDKIVLAANVSYEDESIEFKGNQATLDDKQKEALLDFGMEFSTYLIVQKGKDNLEMIEYTILRLLEYWSKSPEGYKHPNAKMKSSVASGIKSRNEGVSCIRKNTYVTAEYDDNRGDVTERILVNGERCIGRCGSGCGSFGILSAWTKDCLDHDRCGRVNGGSTNPLDVNCGDEYWEASDDYLFGVIRGCRG